MKLSATFSKYLSQENIKTVSEVFDFLKLSRTVESVKNLKSNAPPELTLPIPTDALKENIDYCADQLMTVMLDTKVTEVTGFPDYTVSDWSPSQVVTTEDGDRTALHSSHQI